MIGGTTTEGVDEVSCSGIYWLVVVFGQNVYEVRLNATKPNIYY
jgi:hypothetical protein